MSRRKETALTTYLYQQRRSRLSVGHHAFEINGGGNVSLFHKHAIDEIVRAPPEAEETMELTNQREVRHGPSRNGRLA
jgi:hypothetical protein